MTDELDLSKLDRRVVSRMVRKNEVQERDVEKAMKSLPDVANNAIVIETLFEESAGEGHEPNAR